MVDDIKTVKTAGEQLKPYQFKKGESGNPDGRPKGSGISITTEIKKKLEEVPEGQKATYLELLINRIFKQAIQDGDQQMIKNIWNYVDGMPQQKTDVTSGGKPIPLLTGIDVSNNNSPQEAQETE